MPSPRLTSVADVTQDQAQRTGPKHQCIIGLRQRGSPPYTISARLFLRLALPSPAAGLTWLRASGDLQIAVRGELRRTMNGVISSRYTLFHLDTSGLEYGLVVHDFGLEQLTELGGARAVRLEPLLEHLLFRFRGTRDGDERRFEPLDDSRWRAAWREEP